MGFRSQLGKTRSHVLSALFSRTVQLREGGPYVSFTFDDFPRSALLVGGEILESFNVHATYYAAMGLMNTRNHLGEQFCRADLHTAAERGHDVALHGNDHLSARRTPVKTFIEDLDRCEKTLDACSPLKVSKNFAYPYGEASLIAKRRIGPRMTSSRGTIPGWNGPKVDLNLLRANPLYGGADRVASAQQLILENEKRRSWLIFYSHDVSNTPSPYGCTPLLLRETVAYAVAHGGQVLTISEVMSKLI